MLCYNTCHDEGIDRCVSCYHEFSKYISRYLRQKNQIVFVVLNVYTCVK